MGVIKKKKCMEDGKMRQKQNISSAKFMTMLSTRHTYLMPINSTGMG